MKYRRLSKEQFEELHKEFINFLATQSITEAEWEVLKSQKPEVVEAEMDIFSDLIWEGVLDKVLFLENIAPQHMYLFHVKENAIALIGLKLNIKTSNERAINFYKKNGFEKIGNHDFQIGKENFEFIAMKKKL